MRRRRGWMVIVIAVAALTAVWRVLPAASPPIYDGNCIANPYLLLGGSPAPQPASRVFPASTAFPTSEVFTGETPPQAQILMQGGSFDNSTALTISITPVPPPAAKPRNGVIEGNVYKFAALTPAGAELEPKAGVTIVLRATKSVPTPVIDRFNGTSWIPLATLNSGCGNTFELTSTQMGEFAAVGPARPQPPGSGGGIPVAAIVAGLVVLLLVAVVALFSLERARHRAR
ncbi:MAG TPA: hypothetical protein VIO13_13070 [Candidatus Dormibacteraeota bacterium]